MRLMLLTSRRVKPTSRLPIYLPALVTHLPGDMRKQTDTPLDSPRSGSDSDAAYDSLRGVLSKVSLGKYFKDFRRREVRLEDLRHLTERDLTEVGLIDLVLGCVCGTM